MKLPTQRIERPVSSAPRSASAGMHFVMECQSDHRWRWRLMEDSRSVFAVGIHSFGSKRECRANIQRLVGLSNVPLIASVLGEGCQQS